MGRKRSPFREPSGPLPETEQRLRQLQDRYTAEDCTKQERDEFFILLRNYARSIALKNIKSKNVYLSPERVDEICTDSTLALLKQYSKPGWRVEASFAGALQWKVREALYKPAKEEQASRISLNRPFSEDSNSRELLDQISSTRNPTSGNAFDVEESDNPIDSLMNSVNTAMGEITEVIDEAYDILPYRLYIRFLPWLLLKIRRPHTRNSAKTFASYFLESRDEDAFEILLLEIRNRIKESVE